MEDLPDGHKATAAPTPPEATQAAADGNNVSSVMEHQVQTLAQKVWNKFQSLDASQRYILAICGIPGSGKTTFASSLIHHLNTLHQTQWHKTYPNAADFNLSRSRSWSNNSATRNIYDSTNPDIAHLLPLDGYHLTRAQLDAMPDPKEAHYRRGAPFTFNPASYIKLLEQLRKPIEATSRTIYAPSFDHAVKDPVENDVPLPKSARIIVVEGLYVALQKPVWSEAISLYDDLWFLKVDIETATKRVAARNFAADLSPSYEEALKRTVENDMRNAKEVLDNLPDEKVISETIESYNDEEWKGAELKRVEDEREEGEKLAMEKEEQKVRERYRLERMGSIAELADAGAGM